MKKSLLSITILFCFSATVLKAQSNCNNLDFENGNFGYWNGFLGMTSGMSGSVNVAPGFDSLSVSPRQLMITSNGYDTLCQISAGVQDSMMTFMSPFGGSYSVRLGNTLPGGETELLQYAYAVTAADTNFTYYYACVFQDPGHIASQQPFFRTLMRDAAGNRIVAGCDSFYSGQAGIPFVNSAVTGIVYRHWSPVTIDLSSYVGQIITISFQTSDCVPTGHYGYCYIDVSCLSNPISNVWPGDCNYDLYATNADLLNLGIAYGSTGAARTSASNSWTAQPATNWGTAFPLGANYKHSDCNGDGVVDLNDTLAITLNYSLNHPPVFQHSVDHSRNVNPVLSLIPVATTVAPNSFADFDVYLGSNSLPVNSIYGLSFTINYDNSLVQNSTVVSGFNGSWFGQKNIDMISLTKDNYAFGKNEMVVVENTHTDLSGYGYVGHIRMRVNAGITSPTQLLLSLSDIKALTYNSTDVPLDNLGASVMIDPNSSVTNISNSQIVSVYSNGINLYISTPDISAASIQLINELGQVVYSVNNAERKTSFEIGNLSTGIYFVKINTGSGVIVKKFEK